MSLQKLAQTIDDSKIQYYVENLDSAVLEVNLAYVIERIIQLNYDWRIVVDYATAADTELQNFFIALYIQKYRRKKYQEQIKETNYFSLERLNFELSNWSGCINKAHLAQKCIEQDYFPWHTKYFSLFLECYLNCLYNKNSLLASKKAAEYWKMCPAENKDEFSFLYKLGNV